MHYSHEVVQGNGITLAFVRIAKAPGKDEVTNCYSHHSTIKVEVEEEDIWLRIVSMESEDKKNSKSEESQELYTINGRIHKSHHDGFHKNQEVVLILKNKKNRKVQQGWIKIAHPKLKITLSENLIQAGY